MLTDFDLSKGSSPPGQPGVVKSRSPNQVSDVFQYLPFNCAKLFESCKNSLPQSIQEIVSMDFALIVLLELKNISPRK